MAKSCDGVYFLDTVSNSAQSEKLKGVLISSFGDRQPFCLLENHAIAKSFPFYFYSILNFLFSFLSVLDLSSYRLYPLYQFFRLRESSRLHRPVEFHLFSTYYLPFYMLINARVACEKLYVYMGNSPLCFVYKYGVYENLSLVLSNQSQKKDLLALISEKLFHLPGSTITIGVNTNVERLKNFSKEKKYSIGFFSEGWWQRDMSNNGFSVESSNALLKHLEKPLCAKAKLEVELFQVLYEYARVHGLTFALYLHPCEERAFEKGFLSPYLKKIDSKICHLGSKDAGVSNFYEVDIGVTMLSSSSIITDRSSEKLKTIYLSNHMLDEYEVIHRAKKSYKDDNEIEVSSFKELESTLLRALS